MLAVIRLFLLALFFIGSTAVLLAVLMLRPFRPSNFRLVARVYGAFSRMLGIKIEIRGEENLINRPVVYVGNHQNTYDIFTVACAVQPNTVSIGKKSLKWAPFFGQVYWLSGNILIDRANKTKAHGTIGQAAKKIKEQQISVWLFPEGTRSRGRGLLKFKSGAFYTAYMAGVPIAPVAMSTTHQQIKLNRWNNGKVIIEYLPQLEVKSDDKQYIREMAQEVRTLMAEKIDALDKELGYQEAIVTESKTS